MKTLTDKRSKNGLKSIIGIYILAFFLVAFSFHSKSKRKKPLSNHSNKISHSDDKFKIQKQNTDLTVNESFSANKNHYNQN